MLFFAFHRGQKAVEADWDICNVYGEGVIDESTARKWFEELENGDFDVYDTPRSGRPFKSNEERFKALLMENGHQTNSELAKKVSCETIIKRFSIIFIQWGLPKNWGPGCLLSLMKTTKKIAFRLFLIIQPAIE
ncbi:histone-lysine N-methyltransferase SETMAR [Trichonephila inaurata madagascariensis]|uniref:Histone-lysine N-methyltransferase SETMAR n=1 Tax=Trichonephila inaurata madagascariensis TaxID=2747483 RepID=A0A8X7C419_9ARAC|nr:histone-lysine N-methyltransferase SETMAR [Trichonephila inaurata madagascariensis]